MGDKSKLDKLKQQKAKIDTAIRKEQNKAKKQQRKDDTRRKILYGAGLLEEMKTDDALRKKADAFMNRFLTRDNDRKLFNLDSSPKKEIKK